MIETVDFGRDGWRPPASASARARFCCEQLERGEILGLRDCSPMITTSDRDLLLGLEPDAMAQKNVAWDPVSGELRGLRRRAATPALSAAMARYCASVVDLCAALLAPYAPAWRVELTSFRPLEEADRRLARRQRNDRLHIDAFPARPTNGARILRCFTNIHPSRARVWMTSNPLGTLDEEMLRASLAQITRPTRLAWGRIARQVRRLAGAAPTSSLYDQFMLRLHDRMKADERYASMAFRYRQEFPPGATWLLFTDAVPHAVLEGQFALEQTFFVPREVLLLPDESPFAIIERLARRRMSAGMEGARSALRPGSGAGRG